MDDDFKKVFESQTRIYNEFHSDPRMVAMFFLFYVEGKTAQAQQQNPINDFQEGQWWLKELDSLVKDGTSDQKRSVAVVRNLIRAAQQESDDPQELQRELFELLVKAARRCNYDLNHAADNITDETLREMFRKRFAMWKAIFEPANGIKDYRSKLYMQKAMLEVKLERAIELLDKNKIDHDIDLGI